MVFCPECWEDNEDNANFCFSCGTPLISDSTEDISLDHIERMEKEKNVEGLITALSDQNSDYRTETICALSNINNEKAFEALIVALNEDTDRMVRCEAAVSLGKIGNPLAVKPLIKALNDANPFVICDVLDALAEIGDNRAIEPIREMLNSTDDDVYEHVLSALTIFADTSSINTSNLSLYSINPSEHLEYVEDTNEPVNTKEDWREDFERLKKERNDRILKEEIISSINYLKSDNRMERHDAVNKLVNIGLPAIDYVVEASDNKNSVTRRKVCDVLGFFGDPRAVKTLIKLLNDNNIHVRRRAANGLINVNSKDAVYPLCTALNDSQYKVRLRAAEALGNIGDHRAINPLIKLSKDNVKVVREKAVESLNKIGWHPENNEKSAEYWLAQKRFYKCAEIGKPAIMPLIRSFDSDKEVRNQAVNAIVQIGEPAVEPLINALNYDNPVIIRKSCDALGLIGDSRAVLPLSEKLNDPEKYIRRRAANALLLIGDERSVKPLCKALNDSETKVRVRAATALGEIGDERAISSLVLRLDDDIYEVSESATEALQKMGSLGENALKRHQKETEAATERKRKLREKEKYEESIRYITDKNASAPYDHVTEREVWKMEKKGDVEGLLKCSIITYNNSFLHYETERQRSAKEIAFRIVVNDFGEEAIVKLIPLLNHPDHEIQMRTIEALHEIGDIMLKYQVHDEFYDEYEDHIDVIDDIEHGAIIGPHNSREIAENIWSILNYGITHSRNPYKSHFLKGEDSLDVLKSNLDELTTLFKNSEWNYERENYEIVSEAANQIIMGINKYSEPFTQGRNALAHIIRTTNNDEVRSAAEEAIQHYYLIPIDCIFSKYGGEGEEKDEIRIVIEDNSSNGQSSRGGRTYSQQLIEENDNYMDDIISGLYGHRK